MDDINEIVESKRKMDDVEVEDDNLDEIDKKNKLNKDFYELLKPPATDEDFNMEPFNLNVKQEVYIDEKFYNSVIVEEVEKFLLENNLKFEKYSFQYDCLLTFFKNFFEALHKINHDIKNHTEDYRETAAFGIFEPIWTPHVIDLFIIHNQNILGKWVFDCFMDNSLLETLDNEQDCEKRMKYEISRYENLVRVVFFLSSNYVLGTREIYHLGILYNLLYCYQLDKFKPLDLTYLTNLEQTSKLFRQDISSAAGGRTDVTFLDLYREKMNELFNQSGISPEIFDELKNLLNRDIMSKNCFIHDYFGDRGALFKALFNCENLIQAATAFFAKRIEENR